MSEVLLYECLRTPRGAGKPGGALSSVPAATLLGGVLGELVRRTGLDTARVGEATRPTYEASRVSASPTASSSQMP